MIAFDVTDKNSFDQIGSWVESVTKNANDKIVKILVGNKCDLDHERKVSKEEGEMLARQFGLKYFECSAKSGLGIAECFEELIEDSYAAKYSSGPSAQANP